MAQSGKTFWQRAQFFTFAGQICLLRRAFTSWPKRDLWKAGIAIVGMLLLLVLMVWVPVSAVDAYEGASGLATPVTGTVQTTPTVDPTMTVLNKEKLEQEIDQLKNQNDRSIATWFWNVNATLGTIVAALLAVAGVIMTAKEAHHKNLEDREAERKRRDKEQDRWLGDRLAEREKRVEERFQAAVTALGDEKEGARIGSAVLLRTFLRPGYEQFYTPIVQLVAANLRLPRTTDPPKDPAAPLPPTALSQALIMTFIEAFPRAREHEKKNVGAKLASLEHKVRSTHPAPVTIPSTEIRSLNAMHIQLDNGFLWYADLKQAWIPQASLRKADLTGADLSGANLWSAYLSEAYLWSTNLSGANLWQADLSKADLRGTDLSRATLLEANLSEASLYNHVDLQGANLCKANLSGASLQQVDLRGTNLSEANPEDALSLTHTDLRGAKGLTDEQKEACKAKGAIIDENPMTSSSQSPVSPSAPSQSNDAQALSAPPAQGSTPTPDTGGSSAPSSSQSDPES